jgi:transposase
VASQFSKTCVEHEELDMKMPGPTSAPQWIGVGIDTARYGHRVTFLRDDRQPATAPLTITENQQGYQQLRQKLEELHRKYPQAQILAHLDAAGQYATNLQRFLHSLDLPLQVSLGEPKRNRDYHKALFPKRTTDATESHAMARYAVAEHPPAAAEVPENCYLLREIASRLQAAIKDTTRATNRLHNLLARVFPELATHVNNLSAAWLLALLKKYPTPQRLARAPQSALKKLPYVNVEVAEKLHAAAGQTIGTLAGDVAEALVSHQVQQLETCLASVKKLEKLLAQAYQGLPRSGHVQVETIPGIGTMTAAVLVAKMISIERFATPEHLVGYFGIFPEENTSGVDRQGNPIPPGTMCMSAKGADLVRRYLWNAAKSAIQCNPAVRDLYARLRARGRRGDVALGHCMRKLLHQAFGVWASDRPYNEAAAMPRRTEVSGAAGSALPVSPQEPPASRPSATEMAAGHKRDNPHRKVVTAATGNVEPPVEPVKKGETRGSIDYAFLREQITLEQVLSHLGYLECLSGRTAQRYGPCPFHASEREKSRSFCVSLKKHVFRCCHPTCHVQGNALDLWALAHQLPLYEATLDLAETFHLQLQRTREEATRNPELAAHRATTGGVITPDAT